MVIPQAPQCLLAEFSARLWSIEYSYDFDTYGERVVLFDAPDGSIGVYNSGLAAWQAYGLSPEEVDALLAAGEFRWHLTPIRDVLGLGRAGPFVDEGVAGRSGQGAGCLG